MQGQKTFSVTGTGVAIAQAIEAAPGAGKRILVTDIIASSDKAGAIIKIIQDTAGVPATLFEAVIGANSFNHSFKTPIEIVANKTASVEIDGTAVCKANIIGVIISH